MSDPGSIDRAPRWALGALLVFSLVLNLVPVWWGLPTVDDKSWALDEISPDHRGLRSQERHRGRYPPLHYDLLRAIYSPIRVLVSHGWLDLSERSSRALLWIIGRVLSSLMATATVLLVYQIGRRVFDALSGLFAASLVAFSAPFVFYAKTVNLEAPYTFWFALALLFFVRAIESHRLRDYLGLAVAMTFSICTKDQAAGLYVLPLLWLTIDLVRRRRTTTGSDSRSVLGSIFDHRLIWSALVAIFLFAWIHDLFSGLEDFRHHLEALRGPGSRNWREFDFTLIGQVEMLEQAIVHTAFVMSWPGFAAAVAGIGLALSSPKRHRYPLALLLFPVSYYIFFISVAQFHYDRFLIPVSLVLSFFSGLAVSALIAKPRLRFIGWAVAALIAITAVRRPLSLDSQMLHDSRYAVADWLEQHVAGDTVASFLGSRSQIEPTSGHPEVHLESVAQRPLPTLRSLDADYLIVNELEPVNAKQNELVRNLQSGDLNYTPVFSPRYVPWMGTLSYAGVRTNLNMVNPPLTVFKRIEGWGPTDDEIRSTLSTLRDGGASTLWDDTMEAILATPVLDDRRVFGPHLTAYGLSPDGWTRGSLPAALVIFNNRQSPAELVVALSCRASAADLPLTTTIMSSEVIRQITFSEPGRRQIPLPAIQPKAKELIILFTDRDWAPPKNPQRRLGVKVTPLRLRRAADPEATDPMESR